MDFLIAGLWIIGGYIAPGILFWLVQEMMFFITNRYKGSTGFFPLGWLTAIVIALFLWPIWVPNAIKDWYAFFSRGVGRMRDK